MKIQGQDISNNNKRSADRPGRGISAGGGKTAGRGTKGQKSRAGHNIPRQFEGGQTNLSLRLPKIRGFRKPAANITEISLAQLDAKFKTGDKVNQDSLLKSGLLKIGSSAKILSNGEISKYLEIEGVKISAGAARKIAALKTASKPESTPKTESAAPSKKTAADKPNAKK